MDDDSRKILLNNPNDILYSFRTNEDQSLCKTTLITSTDFYPIGSKTHDSFLCSIFYPNEQATLFYLVDQPPIEKNIVNSCLNSTELVALSCVHMKRANELWSKILLDKRNQLRAKKKELRKASAKIKQSKSTPVQQQDDIDLNQNEIANASGDESNVSKRKSNRKLSDTRSKKGRSTIFSMKTITDCSIRLISS